MNATVKLHDLGQSIWLDNITRDLLESGTLRRYIDELSVTGLTSNPTIFDHAIKNSATYDTSIASALRAGRFGEDLFFDLALHDLTQAADLFKPVFERTDGVDGWVSLEVSPLLAHDTTSTLAAAKALHERAGRPNLFIKIPGTPEGLPAIEEAIFAGVPINVTLLFSREQYVAAAEAYMRGVERRIAAGLNPAVGPSPRCSSAVGTSRSRARCRRHSPTGWASPSVSAPTRLITICLARRAGGGGERRGSRAAPAVGQHGHQGPKGVRHPLRQGTRRAVDRQHHA